MAGRRAREVNYRYLSFARRRGINPSRGVVGHKKDLFLLESRPREAADKAIANLPTQRREATASQISRSSEWREVRGSKNQTPKPKRQKQEATGIQPIPVRAPHRG